MPDAPRVPTSRSSGRRRRTRSARRPSAAALEELRVRYLGRKSALTQVLRSIGELPPEERGPVGQGANEVRRALEAPDRGAGLGARGRASSSGGWPTTVST